MRNKQTTCFRGSCQAPHPPRATMCLDHLLSHAPTQRAAAFEHLTEILTQKVLRSFAGTDAQRPDTGGLHFRIWQAVMSLDRAAACLAYMCVFYTWPGFLSSKRTDIVAELQNLNKLLNQQQKKSVCKKHVVALGLSTSSADLLHKR